jgi:uncharacterized protein YxeA
MIQLFLAITLLVILIILVVAFAVEQENCEHKCTFIQVENVAATCEKTTIICMDCGKKIKTETDCR